MYNWKKLDDIDSSTIIENNIENVGGFNTLKPENLKFDIKYLIENMPAQFSSVCDVIGEDKYVHNAIAFFGGGKNYSVFENNISSVSFNHAFQPYEVSFADLPEDHAILRIAAGAEPFRFYIYDSEGTFKYNHQQNLSAEEKYGFVYGK